MRDSTVKKELIEMGSVNLTGVTPPLFIITLIFVLAIFSMYSMAILRAFQKRTKQAINYGTIGVVLIAIFAVILTVWFS
jgi:Na+-driven multidrug efflux pump